MNQIKTGKFIAQMRKEKGMTQAQLADLLFISNKTVSKC
ncbi:MAG: helix-turn-helix domain-containing protein [Ruminococcus sp.]|nr:helix-turn-helix domain-containing protein [Ruminococcus sp.]